MVKTDVRLWRGLFKVEIIKWVDVDKQNCLVKALEDHNQIEKGDRWITNRINVHRIVKEA